MRTTFGALVLATALALGACGDDDEPLDRQAFVEQADAVCRDAQRQINELGEPADPAELGAYVDRAKPVVEQQIDDLRKLESRAPDEVERDFSTALDVLRQQVPILDDIKEAGRDPERLNRVSERANRLEERADALAKKIGLSDCGQD